MELLTQTDWLKLFLCPVAGFLTCWLSIPLILRWTAHSCGAKRLRDFHHGPTMPVGRLGGLALATAFVMIAGTLPFITPLSAEDAHMLRVVVLSSVAMFGLGLWDDFRPLGARLKFIAQIVIASAVYFGGIKIEILKNPWTGIEQGLGLLGFFVTILWLVTLTNLINLVDGIDGLAGGICLMLMCLLANLGMGGHSDFSMLLSLGMAGALIGFLKFNYPPARIYMGDGGAYFLGFLIGTLSIVNSNKGTVVAALIAPAFALALPITDVSLAVLRRGLRGLPLFRPDRKHIHHHLLTLGFSHKRAVLILYSVSSLCLFLAFEICWLQGRWMPLFSGLLFLILVIAGHVSGFAKDWFSIGGQLSKSLALRKETRHALAMSSWLEMDVERYHSVDELWEDYQLVVKKMGFSRVKLVFPNGIHTWEAEDFESTAHLQKVSHEVSGDSALEFAADQHVLPDVTFKLFAELAAETWHKASCRWRKLNPESIIPYSYSH
jgi:UDP-GlcNAc:undecaprenyl-phosphate GlcNAc-1-phosphate transferase